MTYACTRRQGLPKLKKDQRGESTSRRANSRLFEFDRSELVVVSGANFEGPLTDFARQVFEISATVARATIELTPATLRYGVVNCGTRVWSDGNHR